MTEEFPVYGEPFWGTFGEAETREQRIALAQSILDDSISVSWYCLNLFGDWEWEEEEIQIGKEYVYIDEYLHADIKKVMQAVVAIQGELKSEKALEHLSLFGVSYQKEECRFCFSVRIKNDRYAVWLAKACKDIRRKQRFHMEYAPVFSRGELFTFSASLDGLLQQLFALHLTDVHAGFNPVSGFENVAYSGISTLWLGLAESFASGRAFLCEACLKPCITVSERGKPRKFCSDACKEWKHKHPGQYRERVYI